MKSTTVITYIYKDTDVTNESLSLDCNMAIFCTGDLYDRVCSIRSSYDLDNKNTIIFIKEINNLDVYEQHQILLNEKQLLPSTYIPFNKTSFIRTLAKTNPFKTGYFLWCNVENLKELESINIYNFLTNKVLHLDKLFIVPQNLAWHYRYLIDKEFYNSIVKGEIPNEIAIYKIVESANKDIIGLDGKLKIESTAINTNIKAVIARYNEDVSWVRDLKCDYIIYNKDQSQIALFENNLPNIGREGHTFFTYIIDNYENLPNYICFLHGVPFDHCLDILDKINSFNMTDKFLPLSTSYILGNWEWDRTYALANKVGLIYETPLKMISSCQSIVSKDLILKTPKEMYEKLLNELAYHEHPQEAYVIENLWPTIFNFNNELIPSCDNCRGYWGGC